MLKVASNGDMDMEKPIANFYFTYYTDRVPVSILWVS